MVVAEEEYRGALSTLRSSARRGNSLGARNGGADARRRGKMGLWVAVGACGERD